MLFRVLRRFSQVTSLFDYEQQLNEIEAKVSHSEERQSLKRLVDWPHTGAVSTTF
jgi:hypothetical protein